MMKNGYFAPLKLIYKEIKKYKDMDGIKGKTPNNTIQERVQRDERFTKIGFGVYALTKYLNRLPLQGEAKTENEKKEREHSAIQGMLLEIGNQQKDIGDTYTNDKKCIFGNKKLGNLATLDHIPPFTYPNIIKNSVRFFDVIWFNKRGLPQVVFEVEHSTDFRDALIKFSELRDFRTKFYCVAKADRKEKFVKEISKNAFKFMLEGKRVGFLDYEAIKNDYKL
jgi:hypothetical protein